jgi:putative sigma-54 modulation protein
MMLTMHVHGLPGRHHERLLALAERRAEAALGRLAHLISRVEVRLSDENGPKGGRARRCVAAVKLESGRHLVAHEVGTDWPGAMGRALERAASALRRVAGRRRDLDRR